MTTMTTTYDSQVDVLTGRVSVVIRLSEVPHTPVKVRVWMPAGAILEQTHQDPAAAPPDTIGQQSHDPITHELTVAGTAGSAEIALIARLPVRDPGSRQLAGTIRVLDAGAEVAVSRVEVVWTDTADSGPVSSGPEGALDGPGGSAMDLDEVVPQAPVDHFAESPADKSDESDIDPDATERLGRNVGKMRPMDEEFPDTSTQPVRRRDR
ncbi:MAG: hypothetical protein ACK5MT_13975 [Actinomycetales bacterium]